MFAALNRLLNRTAFPVVTDPEAEAHKLAVLRICTGAVLLWRNALQWHDALYYFEPVTVAWAGGLWPVHALAAAAQVLLSLGLLLGVAPVLCALALMATHPAYSIWTGTYYLGPMLLMPILGALAALHTGRLCLLGRVRAAPAAAHFRAAYLIIFLAYAGWSFQALLYHVRDVYWVTGHTTAVLFRCTYMARFIEPFQAWEAVSPATYLFFSRVVGALHSLFQLAMIPLIVTRWGRHFVQYWGWAFVLGSLIHLRLSLLPWVEVIMWAIIFIPAKWFGRIGAYRPPSIPSPAARYRPAAVGTFVIGYGALSAVFFVNAISDFSLSRLITPAASRTVLFYAGLVAPNVFNREDLTMGDRWPVIERIDRPTPELVPFLGPRGERLAYHLGDQLYFGNSLRWRRGMIDLATPADVVAYHASGAEGHRFALAVATYHHRRTMAAGPGTYRVRVFRNHASDITRPPGPERQATELVHEFTFTVAAETS